MQVGNLDLNYVTFGQGRFVAAGNHSTAWYSPDGVNWTQASGLSGEANFFRVLFTQEAHGEAGQFVAVASEATVWYSSDGMTWTQATVLNGESSDFSDVAYGAGKYVAVGAWNTTSYSTDGIPLP